MFDVYVIYNQKHGKIYIGQTENFDIRKKLHDDKVFRKSFTARFDGEWVLIYKETHFTRKQALIREKQLKSYRGREFLKQYIPL